MVQVVVLIHITEAVAVLPDIVVTEAMAVAVVEIQVLAQLLIAVVVVEVLGLLQTIITLSLVQEEVAELVLTVKQVHRVQEVQELLFHHSERTVVKVVQVAVTVVPVLLVSAAAVDTHKGPAASMVAVVQEVITDMTKQAWAGV
jgi:hypothetical protein